MSVYLLTWNPKHFSTGGEGSEAGTLNYAVGENVRWSCHSQQPKIGDTVYLIKVGVEPRGIVAKGTVSKESYLTEHWSDASKQKHYIDFKLEGLRSNCEQGLLPMMLLQGAMPDQKWSPQTSGIEIKQGYRETLLSLWEGGDGQHSVEQFFRWYLTNEFNPDGWYKSYVETCELANHIQNGKEIAQDDVKKLWYDSSNGIAGVGQGFMYQREFDANYEFLLGITSEILTNPTEETYQKVINDWKLVGNFERVLWGVIHRVFAAADPKKYTSVVAQSYLNDVYTCLKKQYQLQSKRSGSWLADNKVLLELTKPFMDMSVDDQTRNILLWSLYEWKATNKNDNTVENDQVRDNEANYEVNQPMINYVANPLNQILYGPPGTGKTYHTIEAAVKAAEPEFYHRLGIDSVHGTNPEQREKLQTKFKELSDSKRIRFVTFHQSYGYEEFVEGLSATSIDGQISYEVKSGILKDICEQASRGVEQSNDPLEIAIESLKSELEEGASLSLNTQRGKKFDVQYHGNTTFRAFPHETAHEDLGNGYPVSIDSVRKLYSGADAKAFYNPSYVKAILNHLITKYKLSQDPVAQPDRFKNFVLVIDEINRGNISKIFGELITLVEDSKRSGVGQTESIEIVLPHSGEKFSVPNNLYLIGTMNTADRSLAMMDTALRRRFDFVEMMPKPELLRGTVVKGIDLEQLLSVLNQRIEILYDREHTLGHAFFIPVKTLVDAGEQGKAFNALVSVFKNKIIPLLEEYFFEDWDKIRLVLADNQKEETLQFVSEKLLNNSKLSALFGNKHGLNQYGETQKQYILKNKSDDVWQNAQAYKDIYATSDKQGE
uniref:5-methylcytosine-specific restriction enzyme B n=1 Tax=Aliivibrio wodanis TaxID=80852 RepID=A0A5Q4ZXU4_9GAMM|nr:5-methylcytosine-specific restriction enzyme B [Aliivibrio wodanis]